MKRWKLLLTTVVLIIAVAFIAIFSVYALRHLRRADEYRRAAAAFEQGDYARAEPLLLECVRHDRNHEAAWEKLARINEAQKKWRNAAECRGILAGLDHRREEYADALIEAQLRTLAYRGVIRSVNALPESRRKVHAPALALAYLFANRDQDAQKILAELRESREDRVRLARLLVQMKQARPDFDRMKAEWNELAASSDDVTAFLAEMLRFRLASEQNAASEAEKHLLRMVEINPEAALPLLGDFYFRQIRYEEAVQAYRKADWKTLPRESVLCYIEALFFLKDKAELQKLVPEFQRGFRDVMLCGFYVEALIAYMDRDLAGLEQKVPLLDDFIRSPLGIIMRFDYAVQSANMPRLLNALKEIAARKELKDFYPSAQEKALAVLQVLYNEGRFAECAGVAEWLRSSHPDNLLLNRIVFLNQGRSGRISVQDAESFLRRFPDDPIILTVAADYFNTQGDFARALELVKRNIARGDDSVYVLLQEAHALEGVKRMDEARARFSALRKAHPGDLVVFKRQLAFALRNQEPLPELPANPAAAPLAGLLTGTEAHRKGQTARMAGLFSDPKLLNALSAERVEDLPLLFYLALRLADADVCKPAIEIYEKIRPAADPVLIGMNLSELHAAAGNKTAALQEAQKAWLAASSNPVANGCYGLRLWEAGKFKEALPYLEHGYGNAAADPRIASAWRDALEKMIAQSYANKDFGGCLEFCRQLLARFPDNPAALKFMPRAQALIDAKASGKEQ